MKIHTYNNLITRNLKGIYIFLIFMHALFTCLYSQEFRRPEMDPHSVVQNLLPIESDDLNYNDVYENLIQLYTSPLDLNSCTREELAATYLLNERQLNSFFSYRTQLGKLLSIYELQAVPDFDVPTIYRILPFVTLSGDTNAFWKKLSNPTDHYLLIRMERLIEQKRGFTDKAPVSRNGTVQRFEGSPLQWYARYRYSKSRNFSVGFTVEKDEGEAFRWMPSQYRYGPDFISFHAQIQNRGRIKNLVLGDYQLQVGQGLIFAAGFSIGKGMETVYSLRRPTTGARPYSSVTESGFFRGISVTTALAKRLQLTTFYSGLRRSGSISISNDLTGEEVVSTLQTDGLHRIPNELTTRANVAEQNIGAHVLYQSNHSQIGGTLLYSHFSMPLQRAEALRNVYEFKGINNLLTGIHGTVLWRNYNIFGEMARSQSGGIGAVAGIMASMNKRWDATVLFRHYDKHFHSFYSNAFGESTRNTNETGLYLGAKYTVHKKVKAGAYMDGYRFPWYRYLVDKKPTYGYDLLLQSSWTPAKKWTLYVIYRQEQRERNIASKLSKQKFVTSTFHQNLILNLEYTANRIWSFRTRVQGSTFAYKTFDVDKGWMILQEINADFGKFSAFLRVSAFNTDSYDARQYAVERDVLYAISMPAYSERGFRNFVLIRYSPNSSTDIWLRFARTDMPDKQTLSSYVDELNTSHRSELKLQLRHRF